MSPRKRTDPAAQLQGAAELLSGMLNAAVRDAGRRQEQALKAGDGLPLKDMKELTAILKDIAGVVKSFQPPAEAQTPTGVVILPEVREDG